MDYFKILGMPCKDKVTGFKGIATSVSFDLYGCVQVWLTPEVTEDGKTPDGVWYDFMRVHATGERVMDIPVFEGTEAGPERKGPPA